MSSNPTDALSKIEAQKGEVARLKRELEIAEAVLRGMQSMLPSDVSSPPQRVSDEVWVNGIRNLAKNINSGRSQAKGRQPGAISHQWRDTLAMLWMNYRFPEGFTEYNAATAAQAAGLPNVRPKDALDRLTAYVSHGYVERMPDGKWRVTDFTAQKYGFSLKGAPTGGPIEAPTREPEEAS